jgi:hypothetical protein
MGEPAILQSIQPAAMVPIHSIPRRLVDDRTLAFDNPLSVVWLNEPSLKQLRPALVQPERAKVSG